MCYDANKKKRLVSGVTQEEKPVFRLLDIRRKSRGRRRDVFFNIVNRIFPTYHLLTLALIFPRSNQVLSQDRVHKMCKNSSGSHSINDEKKASFHSKKVYANAAAADTSGHRTVQVRSALTCFLRLIYKVPHLIFQ